MIRRQNLWHFAVLVVTWGVIYGVALSSPVMLDDTDTVHAAAVREMAQSGDWVTLTINNGVRYLEKAPLMYWLCALSVKVFGLAEWTVRLPVALFHLLLAFLLLAFGRRFFDHRTGFLSALIYLTCIGPYAFTRILHPDVILTFFVTLALYCYLRVDLQPDDPAARLGPLDLRCMGIYAASALGVLTKGLIGVIFVGGLIFLHLLLTGRWALIKRLQVLPGIPVFLAIAAPWHLAAGLANPGFFWFYFVNEHFLRYLGLRYPNDWAAMPVWLFWALMLVWLFPWTAFLPGLIGSFPRSLRPNGTSGQVHLFLFLWAFFILTFFSFSTTQEYYTFPALPAFCLLLGQAVARMFARGEAAEQRRGVIGLGVLAGFCLAVAAILVVLAWMGHGEGSAGELSETLTADPGRYLITFGLMQEFTVATFGGLVPVITLTAVILVVFPPLAWWSGARGRWRHVLVCLVFMMVGFFHCYRWAMQSFEPVLTSKQFVPVIREVFRPGDRIVVNGIYEWSSSLNFYSGIQLTVLNGHFGNLWYGSYFPDAPKIFLHDEEFLRLWSSSQRVFFFTENGRFRTFLQRHPEFPHVVVMESGGKRLLVNRNLDGGPLQSTAPEGEAG